MHNPCDPEAPLGRRRPQGACAYGLPPSPPRHTWPRSGPGLTYSRYPALRLWVVSRRACTEPRLPVRRLPSTFQGPLAPGCGPHTRIHSRPQHSRPRNRWEQCHAATAIYGFSRLPLMDRRISQLTLKVLPIHRARPGHVRLRASECRPRAAVAPHGRFTVSWTGSWELRINPTGGAISQVVFWVKRHCAAVFTLILVK